MNTKNVYEGSTMSVSWTKKDFEMRCKLLIKERVKSMLDEFMSYETTGNDFVERMSDELNRDVIENKKGRVVELDNKLYEMFLNNISEHISSGLKIK
jgi:hypothetical protein